MAGNVGGKSEALNNADVLFNASFQKNSVHLPKSDGSFFGGRTITAIVLNIIGLFSPEAKINFIYQKVLAEAIKQNPTVEKGDIETSLADKLEAYKNKDLSSSEKERIQQQARHCEIFDKKLAQAHNYARPTPFLKDMEARNLSPKVSSFFTELSKLGFTDKCLENLLQAYQEDKGGLEKIAKALSPEAERYNKSVADHVNLWTPNIDRTQPPRIPMILRIIYKLSENPPENLPGRVEEAIQNPDKAIADLQSESTAKKKEAIGQPRLPNNGPRGTGHRPSLNPEIQRRD